VAHPAGALILAPSLVWTAGNPGSLRRSPVSPLGRAWVERNLKADRGRPRDVVQPLPRSWRGISVPFANSGRRLAAGMGDGLRCSRNRPCRGRKSSVSPRSIARWSDQLLAVLTRLQAEPDSLSPTPICGRGVYDVLATSVSRSTPRQVEARAAALAQRSRRITFVAAAARRSRREATACS